MNRKKIKNINICIDELIERLVRLRKRVPQSLRGAYPKLKPMTEKEEEVFDV